MNTRQGTAIGIAAGIGTTILSLALPHFFPALSSTALNLMGVTGVALLVGSIVSLLLPNILSRSSKSSPLEIIFDRNNPDGKFWSIEIAVDESNNGPQVRYWEYRAGIKKDMPASDSTGAVATLRRRSSSIARGRKPHRRRQALPDRVLGQRQRSRAATTDGLTAEWPIKGTCGRKPRSAHTAIAVRQSD